MATMQTLQTMKTLTSSSYKAKVDASSALYARTQDHIQSKELKHP